MKAMDISLEARLTAISSKAFARRTLRVDMVNDIFYELKKFYVLRYSDEELGVIADSWIDYWPYD